MSGVGASSGVIGGAYPLPSITGDSDSGFFSPSFLGACFLRTGTTMSGVGASSGVIGGAPLPTIGTGFLSTNGAACGAATGTSGFLTGPA